MIKIGITGSIAMGKTTIANALKRLQIPVHDSDKTVKELIERNQVIISEIKKNWPEAVNNSFVNKTILREIIFSNKKDKLKLENMLHPLVRISQKEFQSNYENKKTIIAFDVPLLYETKQKNKYDYIFLAVCNDSTQTKRALKRKTLNLEMLKKIKDSQLTVENKIMHNPIVINTEYPRIVNFVTIFYKIMSIKLGLLAKNG